MADKATAHTTASVLLDEIKSSMNGGVNYEPADYTEKWLYAEETIGGTSGNLFSLQDFLATGTTNATSDKIKWMAIKNISIVATDGICICLDGDTAAYDLVDGMFIGAGEMMVIKCPNATFQNIHAAAVTMDGKYGFPTAAHSGSVICQVAAIMKDISA